MALQADVRKRHRVGERACPPVELPAAVAVLAVYRLDAVDVTIMEGILPDRTDRPGIEIVVHGQVLAGVMTLQAVQVPQVDRIDQVGLCDYRPPFLVGRPATADQQKQHNRRKHVTTQHYPLAHVSFLLSVETLKSVVAPDAGSATALVF